MDKKLFQNDNITGNSLLGFEFKGQFKDDENIFLNKLKDILNRSVSFSNVDYKLLEPTSTHAAFINDNGYYEVKTPMYSYFEALFVLPKIVELLKTLKSYKNSYLYFKIGFNESFCELSQINIVKFILEFNEDFILKSLIDITKDGTIEKLTDIKPKSLEVCNDTIQKQLNSLKFEDDEDLYGVSFNKINTGYIVLKYAQDINYKEKYDSIIKCINHTIITLYNTCTIPTLEDNEIKKIESLDKEYKTILDSFRCYELFKEKYRGIKLTSDLNNDISVIEVIFPSIKDKLFDIVIRNGIKEAEINYDSDVSKLQLKNLELKNCYHISYVDIVESELDKCALKNCDIYDTKIKESSITKCNLFGYADCTDSKLKDCFISRNIVLKDCHVCGQMGKMGGTMKGGSLKNTTVLSSMADISDNVEKNNVNEIK